MVAEEVRGLAIRSAEAARQTTELLEEVQKSSTNGYDLTQNAMKAMADTTKGAEDAAQVVQQMPSAAEDQAEAIDQANRTVNLMSSATQDTAANAEESASTGEELAHLSRSLNALVQNLTIFVHGDKQSRNVPRIDRDERGGYGEAVRRQSSPKHDPVNTASTLDRDVAGF